MGLSTALSPLRERDFRLLWVGGVVSQIGTMMNGAALEWQIYELSGRDPQRAALALGSIGIARVVPMICMALVGGVIADAVDRRRLLLTTQSLLTVISAALALCVHFEIMSLPILYAATAISGAIFAIDNPAQQALIPNLVPPAVLPNAINFRILSFQIATVVGRSLGGIILAQPWGGPRTIYIIDAASFGAILVGLALIRHRPPKTAAARVSIGAALDGLRFIRSVPILWSTTLLDFVATFFVDSNFLIPLFVERALGLEGADAKEAFGYLRAAPAVGALVSLVFLLVRDTPRRQGITILASVVVYGIASAAFGFSASFWPAFFFFALTGAADTVSMSVRNTIRQEVTPNELRGRMTSVSLIFFAGGPQLGEFESGVVASLFGVRAAYVTGGVACVAFTLAIGALAPWLRRHRRDGPPQT